MAVIIRSFSSWLTKQNHLLIVIYNFHHRQLLMKLRVCSIILVIIIVNSRYHRHLTRTFDSESKTDRKKEVVRRFIKLSC